MAGASCSGKSTLAERLTKGQLPGLATTLGLNSALPYYPLYGRDWDEVHDAPSDRVLVQYDLTDRNPFAEEGALRDETLELLKQAQTVTFLTVWEYPEELERRLTNRFKDRGGIAFTVAQQLRKRGLQRAWHSLQRFRQRQRLFKQPDGLWQLYQAWFVSSARLSNAQHWILRSVEPDVATRVVGTGPASPLWRVPLI